ncbi:MAG: DUF4252 domain-containing protein [Mediterranea sp.]|jgi:hypothetical protein|nr:DUF4252 domain-containing protein [Mediterranea sp.]
MKRTYIITLLLTFCSLATYAQSDDNFFDRFADWEGVSSVYISKAMLGMMPNIKTEGVNIGSITGKLDNIQILSSEAKSVIARMRKELGYVSPKNGYEQLMRTKEDGESTSIYIKQLKAGKREFVLISDEKDELSVIVVRGDLSMKDIQGIVPK